MDLDKAVISKLTGRNTDKLQEYTDFSYEESQMKIEKTKNLLVQNFGPNYMNILIYVSITLIVFILLVMVL
jgi:hypothetical protein